MLKKITIVIFTVIVTLALIAGCSKGATSTTIKTTSLPTTTIVTTTAAPTTSKATTTSSATTQATTTQATTSYQPTTTTTKAITTTSITTTTATKPPTITSSTPITSTGDSLSSILGKGSAITSLQYDMEIIGTSPSPPMKVYIKNTKMRMETGSGSQAIVILVDNAARTSIIIMGNIAMIQNWKDQDTPTGQAGDILGAKPTVLPDETFDGKLCSVVEYMYSTSQGSVNAKAWIWKEYGLPIKVVSTDAMGQMTTIIYKNIVVGGDIPESLFQVPPGITVISGIPTSLPGM